MSDSKPDDPTKLAPGEQWDATKGATKAAKDAGVDMAPIQGTGEGGTVTEADVDAHVAASTPGGPVAGPGDVPGFPGVKAETPEEHEARRKAEQAAGTP